MKSTQNQMLQSLHHQRQKLARWWVVYQQQTDGWIEQEISLSWKNKIEKENFTNEFVDRNYRNADGYDTKNIRIFWKYYITKVQGKSNNHS